MAKKTDYPKAHNPLIIRSHRLMEAFAKSDDERDFYLDRVEGFLLYIDLDKSIEELQKFEKELKKHETRYFPIPKLTFYEAKKIMEGFVHEKVYDIDTKEKLLDIISSKEARENFLDFVYDHDAEFEKWQQYYQERSRIRIIEWLRRFDLHFVFEEDLDLTKNIVDKLKQSLFDGRVSKEISIARKSLEAKAKTYYSNEALNPRPKRGRPPKQIAKVEIEPQISSDLYSTVPDACRPFLFVPDIATAIEVTFSSKFENAEDLLATQRKNARGSSNTKLDIESLQEKLQSLRALSSGWAENNAAKKAPVAPVKAAVAAPKEVKKTKPKAPLKKLRTVKKEPAKKKTTEAKPKKVLLRRKAATVKPAAPAKPKKTLLRRKPATKKKD